MNEYSSPSELEFDSQYISASEHSGAVSSDSVSASSSSDDESASDSIEIAINFDHARNCVMAHHEQQPYEVYYMDLYVDEYKMLQQIWEKDQTGDPVSIQVKSHNICIEGDQLSICRQGFSMNTDEWQEPICGTEFIACAFNECGGLMVKYRNEFYFAGESFTKEYKDVLKHSKMPNGSGLRIRSERIVADETDRMFHIIQRSEDFKPHQKMVVIEATMTPQWHMVNGLKRYMRIPWQQKFCALPHKLIYADGDGSCDELYAETDYLVTFAGNDGAVTRSMAIKHVDHANDVVNGSTLASNDDDSDVGSVFIEVGKKLSHGPRVISKYFVPSHLRK